MARKPTYEELEQRVKELEKGAVVRQQAEEALRESEERYRTIFELAADCIVLIDGETGELVEFNERALDNLGFSREEFEKLKIPDFEVIESAEEVAKHIKKIIKEGSDSFETKHRTKSGEIRDIQVSSRGISIRGKNFVQSIWRNISEHKRAEEALHQSDREMRIRNRIAQIFLTTSGDEMYGEVLQVVLEAMESKYGTFAYIDENGNRVVPSMTRGIWDECKVRQKDIFFPRETWGNNLWAKCLIEKRTISSNGPFKVPDGHIPITRALGLPIIHQGEAIGNFMVGNKATDYDERDKELLKTIADHTAPILDAWLQRDKQEKERKRAEEEIKSLARFPSENPNPVLRVATDGTVLYANEASLPLLDTWGCQVSQCLPDGCRKFILDVLSCGSSKGTEIKCGDRAFSLTFAPAVDADYVNLYGLDITERKRAENQLKWELAVNSVLAALYKPLISPSSSIAEIANTVLDKAMSITGSAHGYVSEIYPITGDHIAHTLTEMLDDQCGVSEKNKRIAFPRGADGLYAGLWGHSLNSLEAFFTNSPKTHHAAKGIPQGHIPIQRFLSVPVMLGEELVGQISLANKDEDYADRDLETTFRLAEFYALAIHRKRMEETLRNSHSELERRVQERTAELQHLSSRLLNVQEDERKRISRELHDSIGQSLAAIKFGLENAISRMPENTAKENVELFKALIPVIQQASDEVRRIHTDLRPGLLDDVGIIATISWFCREFERLYFDIQIEKQINIEEKEVPDSLKTVIFRILQEALHNVAEHAKPCLVRVALTKADDQIELFIEDNGQGFDIDHALSLESSERRFGLTSMKERAELSRGSFAIESTPGAGTTIRASWQGGVPR